MYYSYLNDFINLVKPAWRNGLARWTSNPKVVGSNPTVGAFETVAIKENKGNCLIEN